MPKYKVGDKVRIREDIEEGWDNERVINVNDSMVCYRGFTGTVVSSYKPKYGTRQYILDVDKGVWRWVKEWLEPVEEEPAEQAFYYIQNDNPCYPLYSEFFEHDTTPRSLKKLRHRFTMKDIPVGAVYLLRGTAFHSYHECNVAVLQAFNGDVYLYDAAYLPPKIGAEK